MARSAQWSHPEALELITKASGYEKRNIVRQHRLHRRGALTFDNTKIMSRRASSQLQAEVLRTAQG
jgi:hypothetical protein